MAQALYRGTSISHTWIDIYFGFYFWQTGNKMLYVFNFIRMKQQNEIVLCSFYRQEHRVQFRDIKQPAKVASMNQNGLTIKHMTFSVPTFMKMNYFSLVFLNS